jgi:hypothetical protein
MGLAGLRAAFREAFFTALLVDFRAMVRFLVTDAADQMGDGRRIGKT